MKINVDPKVYNLAELFVDDMELRLSATKRIESIWRVAHVMQDAIEDECQEICSEQEPRDYADAVDSGGPGAPILERDK